MVAANSTNCPACGASLDVTGKQGNFACPYCGNNIMLAVPPEPVAPIGDLARDQAAMVNNVIQSAMDLQNQQVTYAENVVKSTMPVVIGSTVVLPIIIGVVTLAIIVCVFGAVALSFIPFFTSFFH